MAVVEMDKPVKAAKKPPQPVTTVTTKPEPEVAKEKGKPKPAEEAKTKGPHKSGEPINIQLDAAGEAVITDLTQRTVGLAGVKGAGKTHTLAVVMEQLSDQEVRYVFLDPIGAMAKKEREKERPSPPNEAYFKTELTATNGMQIAELICQPNMRSLSFQLDLSGLDQPDRIAFTEGLAEGLLLFNKEDLIFIADEVQNFVPSKPMRGQSMGKGNIVRLFAEGRNKNIGSILATQRLAKVHADVRELIDVVVFHQMIHALSLKAAEELLRHHVTSDDELQAILSRIQNLGTGQVYVFNPAAVNPNRNKGGKPEMAEAEHIEVAVMPLDGEDPVEPGPKDAPEPDDEENAPPKADDVDEDAGKAIPAENLPPKPVSDLFRFDQALTEGKVAEARWDAGSHGTFRALGVVTKVTKEHFLIALHDPVKAGKATYPSGHVLRLPRYAKPSWGPLNGVFPMPATGKAGDPDKVFDAAIDAAQKQGLDKKDAKEVAEAAKTAAEGRYTIRAETPKGEKVAKEAKAKHDSAFNERDAAFEQVIIASEPAAAQTHMTKHGRPGDEVYADDDFQPEQLHHLAVHEWTEEHAMRKGLTQQQAHQVANAAERANAGPHVFERGLLEAQKVAEKARVEVGIAARGKVTHTRPTGSNTSAPPTRRSSSDGKASKRGPGNFDVVCTHEDHGGENLSLSDGGANLADMSEVRRVIREHKREHPTHTNYFCTELFSMEGKSILLGKADGLVWMMPLELAEHYREYDRRIHDQNDAAWNAEVFADIKANGIRDPLHFAFNPHNGRGLITEGNHRILWARELGITHVPVRGYRSERLEKGPIVPGWEHALDHFTDHKGIEGWQRHERMSLWHFPGDFHPEFLFVAWCRILKANGHLCQNRAKQGIACGNHLRSYTADGAPRPRPTRGKTNPCTTCGEPATRFIGDAFFCDKAACEPGRTASGRYGKAPRAKVDAPPPKPSTARGKVVAA